MKLLTEFEDRLSVVPRWTIVRTIQKQSVAEHSFRVSLIAEKIAVHWYGVTDHIILYRIQRFSKRHDLLESITSDVPSIVNDLMGHDEVSVRYSDIPDLFLEFNPNPIEKLIVKQADCLEAMIFLNTEVALGNNSVTNVYNDVQEGLQATYEAARAFGAYLDIIRADVRETMLELSTVHPMNRRIR